MIWARTGGREDGPLLVLLHGLGATADVFLAVESHLPEVWEGGWLSVDLPGHGRSSWTPPYTFADQAKEIASVIPEDRDLVFLGHSMGAMTAMELTWLRPRSQRVIGFSIKTYWPETHLAGLQRQAQRDPVVFGSRDVAVGRYLKLAGLEGLVSPEDPQVASGVVEVDGGWRVAQDPKSFDFGQPDMRASVDRLTVPLVLARGSEDHLVREANVTEFVDDPITLDGLGHNPHLQDPAVIAGLVAR